LSGNGYSATVLVNGSKIGGDLGSVPWGWFTLACAIAGAVAIWRERLGLGALSGVAAVALAAVNVATVGSSHIDGHLASIIPRGVTIDVSIAWGSWVVLGTSLVLVVGAAFSLVRER
jgi:hypothetical protein